MIIRFHNTIHRIGFSNSKVCGYSEIELPAGEVVRYGILPAINIGKPHIRIHITNIQQVKNVQIKAKRFQRRTICRLSDGSE